MAKKPKKPESENVNEAVLPESEPAAEKLVTAALKDNPLHKPS